MVSTVRSNVVFFVLLGLLGLLGISLAMRQRETRDLALAGPSASASASAAPSASVATAVSARAAPGVLSPAKPKPSLGRVLRVESLGWELGAPLVLANDGLAPKKSSELGKAGLEVALGFADDVDGVERALARGGTDEAGADVALVPLPVLVSSWERLRALDPTVFLVLGFGRGSDVLTGKQPLDNLPASGDVLVRGSADSSATALALFALDLAGVSPSRVKLVDGAEPKSELWARRRAELKAGEQGEVLIGSAEASRLVPLVAVAGGSFVAQHQDSLMALAKGWLAGAKRLAADPTGAARTIAALDHAPEPITLLARLGEIAYSNLGENAELVALSGRGAVTLESLFQRTWRLEREAKLVTVPAPERAPVSPAVVAALVRADPGAARSEPAKEEKFEAKNAKPLVVERIADKNLDDEQASAELGFIAGVFARSNIAVTAYRGGAADKSASRHLIERAVERYGLPEARFVIGKVAPRAGTSASFQVMALP
jgi:hypothetical protein